MTFEEALKERECNVAVLNDPKNDIIDMVIAPEDTVLYEAFLKDYKTIGKALAEEKYQKLTETFRTYVVENEGLFFPLSTFLLAQAYGSTQGPEAI